MMMAVVVPGVCMWYVQYLGAVVGLNWSGVTQPQLTSLSPFCGPEMSCELEAKEEQGPMGSLPPMLRWAGMIALQDGHDEHFSLARMSAAGCCDRD